MAARAEPPAEGSVGAGAGARTQAKLFGIGRAMKGRHRQRVDAHRRRDGPAALVAVNAIGDVVDPAQQRQLVAGARSADDRTLRGTLPALLDGELPSGWSTPGATTIGIVATDAVLGKPQAR